MWRSAHCRMWYHLTSIWCRRLSCTVGGRTLLLLWHVFAKTRYKPKIVAKNLFHSLNKQTQAKAFVCTIAHAHPPPTHTALQLTSNHHGDGRGCSCVPGVTFCVFCVCCSDFVQTIKFRSKQPTKRRFCIFEIFWCRTFYCSFPGVIFCCAASSFFFFFRLGVFWAKICRVEPWVIVGIFLKWSFERRTLFVKKSDLDIRMFSKKLVFDAFDLLFKTQSTTDEYMTSLMFTFIPCHLVHLWPRAHLELH